MTWDEVEAFCYGELGLKPYDYYRLTFREYILMRDGYQVKRSRDFEHTRLICYSFAQAFRDPNKPLPPLEKFMPLPLIDSGEVKQNEDDLETMRQRLVERYNKAFGKNLA